MHGARESYCRVRRRSGHMPIAHDCRGREVGGGGACHRVAPRIETGMQVGQPSPGRRRRSGALWGLRAVHRRGVLQPLRTARPTTRPARAARPARARDPGKQAPHARSLPRQTIPNTAGQGRTTATSHDARSWRDPAETPPWLSHAHGSRRRHRRPPVTSSPSRPSTHPHPPTHTRTHHHPTPRTRTPPPCASARPRERERTCGKLIDL